MTAPQEPTYRYETAPPEEMTYEEYLALVAAIALAAEADIFTLSIPYMGPRLSQAQWVGYLDQIYPIVEDARRQVSDVARRFYDSERNKHVPPVELPLSEFEFPELVGTDGQPLKVNPLPDLTIRAWERLDIDLAPYKPEWFEEAMDAVVLDFKKPDRDQKDIVKVLGAAQKEIENGSRRTTLYAVQDDAEAIGWARVEGNENVGSCAFCAMLISRGPVYGSAEDAGEGAFWHPNCDCKVVPVFKRGSKDWPGYAQYRKLEKLWAKVTKDYAGGAGGGEKLNAFRRYLNDEPFITDAARRNAA